MSQIEDDDNMIKISFLKFHEQAHLKFKGNYDKKLEPRYLLSDELELIHNKQEADNEKIEIGEAGNAIEFYIFKDYDLLNKLLKSTENLSKLKDVNLLTGDNFEKIREIANDLVKDVEYEHYYTRSEIMKKKWKIIKNWNVEQKGRTIRYYDLDIEEISKQYQ